MDPVVCDGSLMDLSIHDPFGCKSSYCSETWTENEGLPRSMHQVGKELGGACQEASRPLSRSCKTLAPVGGMGKQAVEINTGPVSLS